MSLFTVVLLLLLLFIIISVLSSGRSQVLGTWSLASSFFPVSSFDWVFHGTPARTVSGVYRLSLKNIKNVMRFSKKKSSFPYVYYSSITISTICIGAVGQFSVPRSHRVIAIITG